MPLVRRLPKFGFTPRNRIEYAIMNVESLQKLVDDKKITDGIVTPEILLNPHRRDSIAPDLKLIYAA